ncbi:ribonuclease activity regulator RraA [Flagellimonas taeanensis]|uniref:ribonuclease activity regulator RraA n=1 Tax=Flavobacteriaceae TaxID=49546 RepID=UPI000E697069|nr:MULTISPECIES: ribonuclease activity regulator RraA [Allomuricauda]MDC6386613.1 ribonuclease activity regulator RraA [Muricauda sp. SK9]RIV51328.1 ribonuclease activity regulator RraA [Allomuricauda taeanensis]
MEPNSKTIKEILTTISTATIATCLFKKGYRNQYIQDVRPLKTGKPTMVGQAYTLRYIPAREDLNPIEVFKNPRHLQRLAVEQCPEDHVLVIDSRKDARAASAGGILITRLMKRGVAGIVTDGGFRDSGEIAELDFPAYHKTPSAPTNLTLHQAISLNEPIGCGDVAVFPGDYIVGDDDGVMVIPKEVVKEVVEECLQMTRFEKFVMEKVKNGHSIIGLYPMTCPEIRNEYEIWDSTQEEMSMDKRI